MLHNNHIINSFQYFNNNLTLNKTQSKTVGHVRASSVPDNISKAPAKIFADFTHFFPLLLWFFMLFFVYRFFFYFSLWAFLCPSRFALVSLVKESTQTTTPKTTTKRKNHCQFLFFIRNTIPIFPCFRFESTDATANQKY